MDANYRPGTFPRADPAQVFGELYTGFVEDRRAGRDPTASYQGAVEWTYAECSQDPAFKKFYMELVVDAKASILAGELVLKNLNHSQMNRVLGECRAALRRQGWWKYREVNVDMSEWTIPDV